MAYDANKLFPQLQNSGLQNKDQPLYQVIFLLIKALAGTQKDLSAISGDIIDINNNETTEIIQQFFITGGRGGSSEKGRTIPGPQGVKGDTGATGASLPGPLGIIKHYVESFPKYIPIMGNPGQQGTTGSQGPMGPVITSRFTEIVKRPIQIFQTAGASTPSGLVYLATRTATASSELDFTSLITSAYNNYIFKFENIVPGTDNVNFIMRTSTNNGSSFDSGGSDYQYANFVNNTGSFSTDDVCSAGDSSIKIAPTIDSGSTTGGINGSLELFNPLNASQYKSVQYHVNGFLNDNQFYNQQGSGWRVSTTDIDAVRFLMSSGSFTGVIRMYGVKNS